MDLGSAGPRGLLGASGSAVALAGVVALLAGLAALPACSGKKEERAKAFEPVDPARSLRTPERWDPGVRPISEVIGGVRARGSNETPELVSSVRFGGASSPDGAPGPDGVSIATIPPGELVQVRYAASDAPAVDVLRVLIDDFLEEDFVVDSQFQGNQRLTLSVDREMARSEIRDMVGALAALVGARLERREGLLVLRSESAGGGGGGGAAAARGGQATQGAVGGITRNPETPLVESRTAFGGAMPVIRVHTFRSVDPSTLSGFLQAFLTPGATIVTADRTMVIADTAGNVDRVMGLIDLLDVPAFAGVEVWTYRLRNRTPESAKSTLDAIATGAGIAAGPNAALSFVSVPGTDLLMAIVREPSVREVVNDLIAQVDRTRDTMSRARYIYRVQHFPTDALMTLLGDVHADRAVVGSQATTRTANTSDQRLAPSDTARIVSNSSQNIIIIEATPDDYADIMSTIRMVDRPPQQVFVRSIIAEVGLNNALRYGVEYFLDTLDIEGLGLLELAGSAPLTTGDPTGSAFFVGGDGLAIVQALQTEAEVAILSQPTLTISNSAEAGFQVGGSVPVITADVNSDTTVDETTAIRRAIEYRDTGLILKITPRINESGEVTLVIEQEINEVGQETDLGPEFTTRKLNTTVTVPHGRTVVLGGIIREEKRDGVSKIPIVGDLPVIGEAFRSRDLTAARTELFITITPMIINTPSDADVVGSPFLAATDGVRRFLHERREDLPDGSLVDARTIPSFVPAGAEPRIMRVPVAPSQPPAEQAPAPEPDGAALGAGEAPPASEREMPAIMRALMESAKQNEPAPGGGGPGGGSDAGPDGEPDDGSAPRP
ncbi:MAG: type II secretion system protein GspD [Phycisphaerales bacterium]